ncbi:cellulase family glycosylhydrolase [Plantactinospora sp. KLBMP9567]|uniref:cellulase family glycosylhydrolase n=1 Tax=Plantactinospora sp. KLBMP9567 TaxID=3085900 RepID=UPI00298122FB|nr:cellulase family glycosylhydrolase [Plantactinospora sp. KLBMP9567]MDW5329538.1 cellulase family glycosylhydrolase [Plantactinospora sp. KLBMP9567]
MAYAARDGRIWRDGEPFVVLGATYFPAAGCRLWRDWDVAEMTRDFAAMAAAGLNTVRIFVIWRDFEPVEGVVEESSVTRLAGTVAAAGTAGLACIVSLFTIWMNGERLDLPWRAGRNLWRDPALLARQVALASRVAAALAGHGNLLGFDLGDEISNVAPDEAARLTPDQVAGWYRTLATAIRRESPGALVFQANDASGVFGTSGFTVANTEPLDLVAVHAFPTWAPGFIESTLSYKGTNLVPYAVSHAAAYGVPLVDELGSYGVDEPTATAYLEVSAASAIANGAAGVVVWCWKDIVCTAEPYDQRPGERDAGLCRSDGAGKPRLGAITRLGAAARSLAIDREPPRTAIYLNDRIRVPGDSYLDPGGGPLPVFYAYLLLKRAHLDAAILAGDALTAPGHGLVICPSVGHLTLRDLRRIEAVAERGATVYVSAGDHLHGFPGPALAGAEIVDYRLGDPGKTWFAWDGQRWPLDWSRTGGRSVTMRATAGTVLATFADDTPAVVANQVGAGQVLFTSVPFERQLDGAGRLASARWESFYERVARAAGVSAPVGCPEPDVEVVVGLGRRRAVVVNHQGAAVRTHLDHDGRRVPVALEPHGWRIVDLTGEGTR